MSRLEGELVEVVLHGLDLAVVADLVAQPEERVLDEPADLGRRVQLSDGDLVARDGDVERVVGEPAVELRPLELASRSSNASSRRTRTALSVIPVSRSRTSRSAVFSSLLRPRPAVCAVCQLVERARIGKTPQSRARVLLPVHRANLAFEQLRRDSGALRPLERQRRRGRGVLPGGSTAIRGAGGRARSGNRSHRGADRRRRDPHHRCGLVARDARRLRTARRARRRRGRPARGRPSRATGHGASPARDLSVPLALAHAHRRGPAQRPRCCVQAPPSGRPVRVRRLQPGRGRYRRDERPLARARARNLRACPLGRIGADADADGPQ